jgi:DNA-binding NarL/FixJ family response regulator
VSSFRVLVADDHEIVRQGLRALLEAQPGWQVVGEAVDGREAVDKAKRLRPDVVVLDVSMPNLNGLEATRQIRKLVPETEVVIFTMHDSEQLVREVLEAGARRLSARGRAGRRSQCSAHGPIVASGARDRSAARGGEKQQRSGRRAAHQRKTAETHRTNLMRKLDLHSVSELVRYAIRNKIVEA